MQDVKFTAKQNILGFSVAILLKLVRLTLRWKESGLYDQNNQHWSEGKSVILVFWHGQQLFIPWVYRISKKDQQKPFYTIASKHGDGRLAAALVSWLSIKSVAGSSSNGGRSAFTKMYKIIKGGGHIIITPDGPRGPAEQVKLGAVKLASMTGAKIVPVAFNAEHKWIFNSWDSLFLPKPFSRTYMLMGEGWYVDKGLSKTQLTDESKKLELALKKLNRQVDDKLKKTASVVRI